MIGKKKKTLVKRESYKRVDGVFVCSENNCLPLVTSQSCSPRPAHRQMIVTPPEAHTLNFKQRVINALVLRMDAVFDLASRDKTKHLDVVSARSLISQSNRG